MISVETLRSYPYFAGASAESLKAVAAIAEERIVDTVVGGDLCCWSAVVEPYQITATGVARVQVAAGG